MTLSTRDLDAIGAQVEQAIARAIPVALRAEFIKLGLATEQAGDQLDAQRDFAFLRALRQTVHLGWVRLVQVLVGLIVLGLAGATVAALRATPAPARELGQLAVRFHLVLAVPGHSPLHYEEPMPDVDDCLAASARFLRRPTDSVLIHGGELQAGCVIRVAPSVEH